MIQGQIFNFESNKLDASKYRHSLQNLGVGSALNQVEPFLIKNKFNFKNLNFSFLKRGNIADAHLIDTNFRNLNCFLYYENKNLESIQRIQDSFERKTKEFFKVLNKDIEILESSILETSIRLNSKFNKVVAYSIFQEKDFEEQYDLFDLKRKIRFRKNQQCSFKRGYIETKEMNVSKVDIVSIELLKETSFFSDSLTAIDVDEDTSLIYRENKFWKYIVGAKEFLDDLQELPHKAGRLDFLINFDGYEDLNNIFIEFGSSLPIEVDLNKVKYFDEKEQKYFLLENASLQVNSNRVEIVFKTIRTNKVKVSLVQDKYHDTSFTYGSALEDVKKGSIIDRSFISHKESKEDFELKRVYDLSILNLECRRKANSGLGFYREAHPVVLNKPLSLQISPNVFFQSENCFIEKYAHIVLYGEEGFSANKVRNQNYTNTKRANVKIPLPNSPYKERELLILNNSVACLNFFPNITKKVDDTIKVFKTNINTGEKVECLIGNDYEVSFDKGNNYINQSDYILKNDSLSRSVSEIFNFYIKILTPQNKYFYTAEYLLNDKILCGYGEKMFLSRGELVFNQEFQSSVGFIRPSFVLRNKSTDSQSSKIRAYNVLIEEIESNEKSYIEYETFIELERKGSSNVV